MVPASGRTPARALRPPRLDIVAAALLAAVGALESLAVGTSTAEVVAAAVAPLPLAWRRVLPLPAALLPVLAYWPEVLGGRPGDDVVTPILVVAACAYTLAAYAGAWRWPAVAVLALQVLVAAAGDPRAVAPDDAAFVAVPVVGGFAAGAVSGSRARRATAAEAHAALVEASAEERRRTAVVAERLRMARELHDVLAHSVGVMVVQAGAAQRVLRTDPAVAEAAVVAVQERGRRALEETAALVGLLRDPAAEPAAEPGLAELGALAADLAQAGLAVRRVDDGVPHPLPAEADACALRVVREALTNVVRHSAATSAEVRLAWAEAVLALTVTDPGPPAGDDARGGGTDVPAGSGGHGLRGVAERVAAVGGTFAAGPHGTGFRVTVHLPAEAGGAPGAAP